MRAVAACMLALLFSRPYRNVPGSLGSDREVALVIDQSASMGAKHSGQSPFAEAQQAAQKILKESPEGVAAHIAYFDDEGVFPTAEARIDTAREAGYGGTDYGMALRWARDLMVQSHRSSRK